MGVISELLLVPMGQDAIETNEVDDASRSGLRSLAASLAQTPEALLALLELGCVDPVTEWSSEAVRVATASSSGPRVLVAVSPELPSAGPGAPDAAARMLAAGLRLGALSGRGSTRIWWGSGESDPLLKEALWRGVWLGKRRAGVLGDRVPAPEFADDSPVPSQWVERADALAWVREMVERPANLLGPAEFASAIEQLSTETGCGMESEIWDESRLELEECGAVLAVGGGSARAPRVVRLRLPGDPELPTIGLVGKGITFDSGGVNLKKDAGELAWMKSDMAAAASIAAAVSLVARARHARSLHSPQIWGAVEVFLPLCDNAVSGSSVRPGDVVRHPGGEATEVVDTDCEGRLVLADGISWLRKQGASVVLDAGTLTDGGAGLRRFGIFTNRVALGDALVEAGDNSVDPGWVLPLPYGEDGVLDSRVADLKNAPQDRPDVGRHAALYLSHFAGTTPWAHLDIGGTAYLEHPIAGWPEGPTASGVLAIAHLLSEESRDWC